MKNMKRYTAPEIELNVLASANECMVRLSSDPATGSITMDFADIDSALDI